MVMNEKSCTLCPRNCRIDRSENIGYCGVKEEILVARAAPHMWEEPCISGGKGSGAVFFSGCNLHCVYCQNKAISDGNAGKKVSVERLAEIFLELQDKNVYNINLVTPTQYALNIKKAILLAKNGLKNKCGENKELSIPIVYNCGGYEDAEVVRELEDVIDIWMPDFKYISADTSSAYSHCADYFEKAAEALDEMVRQVREKGGIKFDIEKNGTLPEADNGIMLRGVIVRHLLLPGYVSESKRILRYLHNRYGNDIYISIMSQYTPMPQILNTERYPELKRSVSKEEYKRLVEFAVKIGIEKAFIQEGEVSSESFIPAFDGEGV